MPEDAPSTSLEHEIANQAVGSLLRDLQNPPSLEELAKEVGLTTFQLSRLFGRVMGKSMPAMLRERRMAEAARMLLESNQNIGDVAIAVGYYSISAFSRAFTRELRVTASEYRRNRHLEQFQQDRQ
ncbi:MAG: helix-turn-helix transcriptional regulator [Roseimicrobium sp.]